MFNAKNTNMQILKRNTTVVAIVALLLVLAGCGSTDNETTPVRGEETPQEEIIKQVDVGVVEPPSDNGNLPQDEPYSKVLAITLKVGNNNTVSLLNPQIYYGVAPHNIGNPDQFTARLLDASGAVLTSAPLWDPRWTFVWDVDHEKEHLEVAEESEYIFVLPYYPGTKTVDVFKDRNNSQILASVEIETIFTTFCSNNPSDPDC